MSHLHRRAENWVLSNSMESEIARGTIDGMSEFSGFGERDNLQIVAVGSDIWRGTSIAQPWPNQLGGEQMMVLSSDFDDRLTGTGFVRTVGTNIRFINAIHAVQVGVGTVASGDISICANGTLATVYNMFSVGGNMSLSTQRMIPYNKTFYLHEWTSSCIAPNTSTITRLRLRATTAHGTRIEGVFLFNDTAHLNNSTYFKHFSIPKKMPELTVVKVTAWSNAAGGYAAASYSGCLEDDDE